MTTEAIGSGSVRLAGEPTPRAALLWLIGGCALFGVIKALWHGPWGALLVLVADIVLNFLIFLWYCRDGNLHQFQRNIWWNMAVIVFALPTLCFYLWRTRPRGQRLRAMLGSLACVPLLICAMGLGAIAGLIVSKII
ncbi:MAG: hypothetical protein ACJ8HI_00325 [Massilia sp.]